MVRALLILLLGCAGAAESPAPPAPASAPPAAPAGAPTAAPGPAPTAASSTGDSTPGGSAPGGVLAGLCEASALVPWQGGWLVGDNEDPRALHAFGPDFAPRGPVALPAEVDDIEALVLRDGGYLVVGSHSANKEGKARPARERLLYPDGRVLSAALDACPACVAARGRAPDAGGFNVEGAAWRDGTLWLGLRAPLAPGGAALLLALDDAGRATRTVELDLGGLGVRDLAPGPSGLLVVAGPVGDGDAAHSLWSLGATGERPERLLDLPPSTEGIALDPADPGRLVYVTDGDGKPGAPCKVPATWGAVRLPG